MESSNLPLAQHFSSLREKPTWGLKLIIAIVIIALSATIVALTTDFKQNFEDAGLSGQQLDQSLEFAKIIGVVSGVIGSILTIGVTFVIILIISKIMKSDASAKSIFFCNFKLYDYYQYHRTHCCPYPMDCRTISHRLFDYKS
ncbi:hypothetical protein [Staphylococcus saprophyticus]|uniref:Uncharacterized protein n=1 Tax=Staphylococcus saprophyticus TaxID=29385 RepID=A0A380HKT2_STASA|nr:hypothetical protein [Staphylococcus saprophyticus]SUM81520.1 Uncharacterised protein [Staphylococcus saprophyticus]